ncbi:hypothetical protein QTI66_25010 [Variovorax sp. J22R133]|uniref:hypothetical protein n=1 Tax=Variovorax brevis TaxID=3053503 RepID=UPI00257768E8|nr:hypothetical protein [Variovorax sp. J22R133]MDM0115433.1 hypothetical protein [Variovorax sp. J22R133]
MQIESAGQHGVERIARHVERDAAFGHEVAAADTRHVHQDGLAGFDAHAKPLRFPADAARRRRKQQPIVVRHKSEKQSQ